MKPRLTSAAIIAAVVLLDRITKSYIRERVSPWDIHPVIPGFFNIVHIENPGAAFGILNDSPSQWRSWLLLAVSLVVMSVIATMLWRGVNSVVMQVGLSLVMGGAIGNFIDRFFRGIVTDFLQFFFGSYEFPSFNAADSAITVGACLLLVDLWRTRKVTPEPTPAAPSPESRPSTDSPTS